MIIIFIINLKININESHHNENHLYRMYVAIINAFFDISFSFSNILIIMIMFCSSVVNSQQQNYNCHHHHHCLLAAKH